ncbi:flagellar hook-length control protein FliK [Desulfosporosinus lacus]|uniref:Flagellar hook-length control protein FliK n=1 Tax=Desulfosporosinus lacus DSM 15449 TaxID=1121420 RepID=A0A1M5USI5_9FIRM|nr:flagellar hook-length control protein FliK [Desulfosporosinus lacus]SHH65905.1 flagellar hook-length control protein FliK [Desulfosporosinus lacus DSM 15449]
MTGINVLSDTFKGGNKLENIVPSKGKETSEGCENAATVFAAMLNGRMNLDSNSKGQGSLADQDSEIKQSNVNPAQDDQNSNGLESILGYGNYVLPFLTEMLQSDLPAGKEANSGEIMSQGIENSLLANLGLSNVSGEASKNLKAAMLNLVSLASDESLESTGMTALSSQGNNLGITELDKYRQVIANLLVALSGEITDVTSEGSLLGTDNKGANAYRQEMAQIIQGWMTAEDSEETSALINSTAANSAETKDLRLELAKILQGWMTMSDDGIESDLKTAGQNRLVNLIEGFLAGSSKADGGDPGLNAKAANLLAALYPVLSEGAGGAKGPRGASEALLNQLKNIGVDVESIANAQKEGASQLKAQQRFEGTGPQENKLFGNFQDAIKEEVNKANNSIKSYDLSGTKDGQIQPSSMGLGAVANVVSLAGADGKMSAIPLWEQISTVVREQVMSKQQALKELDIQLHPAELGSIRIFLRWESGQVHLQVQASEAATGQLLQNQLSDLRQNLMNQGVNCGSLQMGQGGEGQQQPQGDEAQRTLQQSNLLTNEDEDQIIITNPNSLGQDGVNRINVTA